MGKKYEPVFKKLTPEEMRLVNKDINDRKQNLIQAIKDYYQRLLTHKQAVAFQARFEKAIADGVEIKDNYGLPMSKEELELEAMKNFIQLKFMATDLSVKRKEFNDVWKLTEEDLEKYWQKWFVENGKME